MSSFWMLLHSSPPLFTSPDTFYSLTQDDLTRPHSSCFIWSFSICTSPWPKKCLRCMMISTWLGISERISIT